jgi:hypothetical protein
MRGVFLIGLAAGALLAAGCGNDGTGSSDSGTGGDGVAASDGARDDAIGQQDGTSQQDGASQHDGASQQQDAGASSCAPHQTPPTSVKPTMAGRTNCEGCHSSFTVSGTLYSAASGGSILGGATVRVKNSITGAVQVELVTDSAGLFYTSQAVTFPANVEISACPDLVTMTAASAGNCAKSGCHTSSFQIHLP